MIVAAVVVIALGAGTSAQASQVASPTARAAATSSQSRALQTAHDYLDYQGFSEKGLIHQLKFDGYSSSDASWAAAHVRANWNEQAVRVAKSYLDYTSFSRAGLLHQLRFEGFTQSQAEYGVSKAY
jgi:hypothetical protein